jgi:putative endonuclease
MRRKTLVPAALCAVVEAIESWSVYIVRCVDGSLYTGIAKDVARRVDEHNASNLLAANYTRARRPVTLVYQEAVATRSAAGKREYAVKCMSRAEKEALIVLGGCPLSPAPSPD